jgi:hypothetical protein
MKRRLSLAILVGWLCQLGLSTLLPQIALFAGRALSMTIGADYSWADHAHDSRFLGWHVVQGAIFVASALAGFLAGYLAPRRTFRLGVALLFLVLLDNFFEQLPMPMPAPPLVVLEWMLAPCLGIVVGLMTEGRMSRED